MKKVLLLALCMPFTCFATITKVTCSFVTIKENNEVQGSYKTKSVFKIDDEQMTVTFNDEGDVYRFAIRKIEKNDKGLTIYYCTSFANEKVGIGIDIAADKVYLGLKDNYLNIFDIKSVTKE